MQGFRIDGLAQVIFHAGLEVPVMIPSAHVDGDHRGTGLDQPSREERALSPGISSVPRAERRVLSGKIESLARRGAEDQVALAIEDAATRTHAKTLVMISVAQESDAAIP